MIVSGFAPCVPTGTAETPFGSNHPTLPWKENSLMVFYLTILLILIKIVKISSK